MASQSMKTDCDKERMQTRRFWVEGKGKTNHKARARVSAYVCNLAFPIVSSLPCLFQLAFSVSQLFQPTVVVAVVCHSDNKRQIEDARLDDKLDSEEESSGDWKENNNQFRLFQKPSVRLACFLGSWIWDFFLRKMQTSFTYSNECACTLI